MRPSIYGNEHFGPFRYLFKFEIEQLCIDAKRTNSYYSLYGFIKFSETPIVVTKLSLLPLQLICTTFILQEWADPINLFQ